MVNFDGIPTKDALSLMAKYIQNTPDWLPEYSFKERFQQPGRAPCGVGLFELGVTARKTKTKSKR